MGYVRTVTCSWCYERGHNRNGCPDRRKYIQENPDSYEAVSERTRHDRIKNRKCSYCKQSGHTRRTCPVQKADRIKLTKHLAKERAKTLEILLEYGLGIGALILTYRGYWKSEMEFALVRDISWSILDGGSKVEVLADFVAGGKESRAYKTLRLYARHDEKVVYSPADKDDILRNIPDDWANGTLYKEDNYFPKGTRRDWLFSDM